MTLEDIKAWLDTQGLAMPELILLSIVASVDDIEDCMISAGYPDHTQSMIDRKSTRLNSSH